MKFLFLQEPKILLTHSVGNLFYHSFISLTWCGKLQRQLFQAKEHLQCNLRLFAPLLERLTAPASMKILSSHLINGPFFGPNSRPR